MKELRFAARALRRSPGFTLVAALALALGIGATTAIFTVVNSVLLRPLGYRDPERLVWMWNVSSRTGPGIAGIFPVDLSAFRDDNRTFERVAGFMLGSWNLTGEGDAVRLLGVRATEGFFETLGVQPLIGRGFLPEEHYNARNLVVLFSYGFWQRNFGGDPRIVGRTVTLDGKPFQVIGIMPPGFQFPPECEMWAPFAFDTPATAGRSYRMMRVVGRLKPGVTLAQAQADMSSIAARLAREVPTAYRGWGVQLVTLTEREVGHIRPTLLVLGAAVAFVLLIACANVANLLLARAVAREKEMAIRTAVGASRIRLVRQLLVESIVLAGAGGVLGVVFAHWGVRLLVALDPAAIPRAQEIHVDAVVLAFALALSVLTGLVFGLAPAVQNTRVNLFDALKDGGRGSTSGMRRNRFRSVLVVSEVALGMVLLIGAGLMARSFRELIIVHPGFDPSNVLTVQIALTDVSYTAPQRRVSFFEDLTHRIERLHGVQYAGAVNMIPLNGSTNTVGFWMEGQDTKDRASRIYTNNRVVTPDYFKAMGVPLLAGRWFTWNDRQGTPGVIVINDVFARQLFPKGGALGQRLTLDFGSYLVPGEIVGIVGSFRQASLTEKPERDLFTPLAQTPIAGLTFVVRAAAEPAALAAAVRHEMHAIDPRVPAYNVRTMGEVVGSSVAQPRLRTALLSGFSRAALALASLGIYGVIAYSVSERHHEIGIRLALGAQGSDVVRMIVGQGLMLAAIGLAVGAGAALALARLLRRFLFGVSETDPLTFAAAALLFLLVAFLASYLPARRALRVDPMFELRNE